LEEAKLAVPDSTEDSSMSGFGANEWLVEEMYERYQKDPNSVDKVWWDFFGKDQRQATDSDGSTSSSGNGGSANGAVTESTGAPKSRPTGTTPQAKPQNKPETRSAPEKDQKSPQKTEQKAEKPQSVQSEDKNSGKAAAKSATSGADDKPTPKEPEQKTEAAVTDEPRYTVLKGAPARSSCCGTTGSSSTTTWPGHAAARCPSPT
jgi:2-oxoglutarate decarboxylase